jgi:hypothetical protein
MKKYVALGLLLGVTLSALILYIRRKDLEGTEFQAIFDASTVADDLFDGLEDLPDRP